MKYILIFLVTVSVTFTNNVQSQTGAAEVDIRVTQAISNQVRTLREGLMSALSLLRSSINDLEQAVSQTKTRLDSTNNDLSVTKNQMTAMQIGSAGSPLRNYSFANGSGLYLIETLYPPSANSFRNSSKTISFKAFDGWGSAIS